MVLICVCVCVCVCVCEYVCGESGGGGEKGGGNYYHLSKYVFCVSLYYQMKQGKTIGAQLAMAPTLFWARYVHFLRKCLYP